MAGRFPFGQGHSAGDNPLHNAQVRAALGLSQVDEALFVQRQQEVQREYQIRQMLLQEQLEQQNRLESMVHEQQLKAIGELQEYPDLQQHYSRILLNEQFQRQEERERNMFRERTQIQHQEDLRRRAMAQASQAQQQAGMKAQPAAAASKPAHVQNVQTAQSILRDIAADSLAGNAVKRSELEKRVFAKPDDDIVPVDKKRPRFDPSESVEIERVLQAQKEKKEAKKSKESKEKQNKHKKAKRAHTKHESPLMSSQAKSLEFVTESTMKQKAQALLDFATSKTKRPKAAPPSAAKAPPFVSPLGSIGNLLEAAKDENKADKAAGVLVDIKCHVEWSDSEREDDIEWERRVAIKKGDTIELPGFSSILPQLPEEPEVAMPSKKKKKKIKSLLDDDSVETKPNKSKADKKDSKSDKGSKGPELSIVEYPYPIDTWWPSVTSIRRERKAAGEPQDEDKFDDDTDADSNAQFRINVEKVKDSLANDVAPGVLEKIPHCRIHRMLMKKRKNPSAPELVYCFQVTELYPNDIMVCCSHCGTWRHTACGGHHKAYSVRESIDAPFTAVCDRCHEEEKILRDHSLAKKRIDRQRSEQIRRGLATSAAMRQASFSKHGGTYKWPLGSVSATHIGGHTRSVHSRHDKAEKQWMDMATRLGRGYGYRPKERVKVRTKELERLLVSVEDAEGHTDRHNMMLFLLQDTMKEHPVGFEGRRRNIFDPDEDEAPVEHIGSDSPSSPGSPVGETSGGGDDLDTVPELDDDDTKKNKEPSACARSGCTRKPRFDSLFCSDSCGVSALEGDLLRTFQYASDIHPSMLRN